MSHPISIEEEPIESYTANHFMNKINEELGTVRTMPSSMPSSMPLSIFRMLEDNSPISMSSGSECSGDDCFDEVDRFPGKPAFRKLSFREVQGMIDKYYESDSYTNEFDLLVVYVKGQKQIYLRLTDLTNGKSTVVLSLAGIGGIIVSILWMFGGGLSLVGWNAFVFVLYFLHIFSGWTAASIAYKETAVHFGKIESSLETEVIQERGQVLEILQKTEEVLREHGIPAIGWECRWFFPLMSQIQLFAFIKRMENYKKNLIMKFKDVKNEIRYIQWKWGEDMNVRERTRLNFLCSIKEKIKCEILQYKHAYSEMEGFLSREMSAGVLSQRKYISENPVVNSYLVSIFGND